MVECTLERPSTQCRRIHIDSIGKQHHPGDSHSRPRFALETDSFLRRFLDRARALKTLEDRLRDIEMDPQSIQLVTEGAAATGAGALNGDAGADGVQNAAKVETDSSLQ